MLQKLSKEQLSAKIGQIEDWALALGIDETRELDRCGSLHVIGNVPVATAAAAAVAAASVTKSVSSAAASSTSSKA